MSVQVSIIKVADLEAMALPIVIQEAFSQGTTQGKQVATDVAGMWHGRKLADISLLEVEAILDLTQRPGIKTMAVTAVGTASPARSSSTEDEDDEDF